MTLNAIFPFPLFCNFVKKHHLNLSFVKDEHIYGKKVARNGRTTVIYEGHSFRNRVYICTVKLDNSKLFFVTNFFTNARILLLRVYSILLLCKWRTKSCLLLPSNLLFIVYYSEIPLYSNTVKQ